VNDNNIAFKTGDAIVKSMYAHRRFVAAALLCLSMGFSSLAQAAVCDADKNGVVDRRDLSLIVSARNTPAAGSDDPRDADGNGAPSRCAMYAHVYGSAMCLAVR